MAKQENVTTTNVIYEITQVRLQLDNFLSEDFLNEVATEPGRFRETFPESIRLMQGGLRTALSLLNGN